MKAADLKTKTPDELQKLLLDTRKAQFNQRFQRSNGQMEKTAEIRTLRRSIARIKTFMNAKPDAQKGAVKPKKEKTATTKAAPAKTKAKAKSSKTAA